MNGYIEKSNGNKYYATINNLNPLYLNPLNANPEK